MASNKAFPRHTTEGEDVTYTTSRAKYESELARAHRSLFRAQQLAQEMNDLGGEHDCAQILREVTRVAQDSLRPHKRPFHGQDTFPGV